MPTECADVSKLYQSMALGYLNCIKEFDNIQNEIVEFAANWKKGYAAHLLEERKKANALKRKKKVAESMGDSFGDATLTTSSRPTRNARNVALDNIRKQSMMPMNSKLRRPDSGEEADFFRASKRTKIIAESHEVPELSGNGLFVKPQSRKRNTKMKTTIQAVPDIEAHSAKEVPLIVNNIKEVERVDVVEENVPRSTPQRVSRSSRLNEISPIRISPIHNHSSEPTIDASPTIVNVLASNSRIYNVIRESVSNASFESTHNKDEEKTEECDIFEVEKTSIKAGKGRKKKTSNKSQIHNSSALDFIPKAESSKISISLDKTVNITPKSSTFVVGNHSGAGTDCGADIFANVTVTVVKSKRNISNTESLVEKDNSRNDVIEEEPVEEACEDLFQVPEPVSRPKRTKVVKAPVCFDADGNELTGGARSTRTKVINDPTPGIPVLEVTEELQGRPVRVRTKVRRYGASDEMEPKPAERPQPTIQAMKTISQKSKARRPSLNMLNLMTKLQASHNYKTPVTNAAYLSAKKPLIHSASTSKEHPLKIRQKQDFANIAKKPTESDLTKTDYLKNKQQKEEAAALKKKEEINRRKELLKQQNNEKLERAKKKRQKEEGEKLEQIKQMEMEKEAKRTILLLAREKKQKEELSKKKMLADQKQAENEERRKIEEEARLLKIKEMEMEQQRILEEKQRQQEYEEKRAKERIEEKKRMQEAEKLQRQKMAEAQAELEKKQNAKNYAGVYLPRNEDDLGLEDEVSEESGDEDGPPTPEKKIPNWAKDKRGNSIMKYITKEQMDLFMPLESKTPDVHRMFAMSPHRTIRRTSSAIWDTTMLTPSEK